MFGEQSANGSERHFASRHGLTPHDLIGSMVFSISSSCGSSKKIFSSFKRLWADKWSGDRSGVI